MDLKKAISLIAFGFLFIFVNLNLSFTNLTINILPVFIGWFLLFLAFTPLGVYMEGKSYMHWIPLVLTAASCAFWVIDIARPQLDDPVLSVVRFILNLVSAGYWFILFGILEKIANDTGTTKGPRIHVIKVVSLVLYIAVTILALLVIQVQTAALATLFMLCSIVLIVVVIIALFTLFGLRKDILRQSEQNLIDQVKGNQ
ncbi:MAG: hypothetical protein K6A77_11200 [Clostridiales bacterium]|nr:hypothetical protein [Clostridiales bacterium]